MTSVLDVLRSGPFRSFTAFIEEYPDVRRHKGRLQDFTLFLLMDVDDCTPALKQAYIRGEMFRGHWLAPHIVPIYCDPNLEATMREAGIDVTRKQDYIRLFPTNHGDLDMETAKDYQRRLEGCRSSNLSEYMKRCVAVAEKNRLRP